MGVASEGEEMFEKIRFLREHLEDKKDGEGLRKLTELIKISSTLITSLTEYNQEAIKYCNEMSAVFNEHKKTEEEK